MNVAGLINSFSTGSYTVTRTTASTKVRGKESPGTSSTLTITASVTPSNPSELLRLPEGRRTLDTLMLITATQLYNGGQGSTYEPDKISINGESWEVNFANQWKDPLSGSVAYRCLLTVVR